MIAPAAAHVPGRVAVRVGPVSGVRRPRVVAVPLVCLALLLLVSALSIGRGDVAIPVGDVLAVLAGDVAGALTQARPARRCPSSCRSAS